MDKSSEKPADAWICTECGSVVPTFHAPKHVEFHGRIFDQRNMMERMLSTIYPDKVGQTIVNDVRYELDMEPFHFPVPVPAKKPETNGFWWSKRVASLLIVGGVSLMAYGANFNDLTQTIMWFCGIVILAFGVTEAIDAARG